MELGLCCIGVQQGLIAQPLSFSLNVNDLPFVHSVVKTQMYADDTVIFENGKERHEVAAKINISNEIPHWLLDICE